MKKFYKIAVGAAWNMAVSAVSAIIVDTFRELYYYGKSLNEVVQEENQPSSNPPSVELKQVA